MLTCVCCSYGRHTLLERAVRCFIDQDYEEDNCLLIYNNSPKRQELGEIPHKKNSYIKLINNHLDWDTGKPYTDVGSIFRDALTYVDSRTTVCTFSDDDDIYFPNHLSEGMKGIERAKKEGKLAYKPYYSWFWYGGEIKLANNTTEPSIFVDFEHVKKHGFSTLPASFHLKWVKALKNGIFDDKEGIPTLIYDWGSGGGAHKISGQGDNIGNFWSHKVNSTDDGDQIITPLSKENMDDLWEKINNLIKK